MIGSVKNSSEALTSPLNICLSETRSILRRWLKTVFTTRLKSFSSHPRSVTLFLVMRMTADFTFGGGLKTVSSTVKRYSVSYHACIMTDRIP